MALIILITFLANLIFIQGRTEVGPELVFPPDNLTHFDVYASALSKALYSPWYCNYRTEPGYKCLSCNKALHCFPGNFALLVQCAVLFPYCRNGYCSMYKFDGCIEEADVNAVNHNIATPSGHKDNKTSSLPDVPVSPDSSHTEVNKPILDESDWNTITTKVNDPNKLIDGMTTSINGAETSNTDNIIEKVERSTRNIKENIFLR